MKVQRPLGFLNIKTVLELHLAISEKSQRRYPQNRPRFVMTLELTDQLTDGLNLLINSSLCMYMWVNIYLPILNIIISLLPTLLCKNGTVTRLWLCHLIYYMYYAFTESHVLYSWWWWQVVSTMEKERYGYDSVNVPSSIVGWILKAMTSFQNTRNSYYKWMPLCTEKQAHAAVYILTHNMRVGTTIYRKYRRAVHASESLVFGLSQWRRLKWPQQPKAVLNY